MLTGTELLPGNTQGGACTPAGFAGGISIDQRIAQDIGGQTRFPSLEFGVMVQSSDVWARMIYSGRKSAASAHGRSDEGVLAHFHPGRS